MDLNLFENRKVDDNFTNRFIEELKNALESFINKNKQNNSIDEFNRYEKKKIYLDNKSRNGNNLAWIMDENSVCISEEGDGGPISIKEIDLPQNRKNGEVYEKINGEYVYNPDITIEIERL